MPHPLELALEAPVQQRNAEVHGLRQELALGQHPFAVAIEGRGGGGELVCVEARVWAAGAYEASFSQAEAAEGLLLRGEMEAWPWLSLELQREEHIGRAASRWKGSRSVSLNSACRAVQVSGHMMEDTARGRRPISAEEGRTQT